MRIADTRRNCAIAYIGSFLFSVEFDIIDKAIIREVIVKDRP